LPVCGGPETAPLPGGLHTEKSVPNKAPNQTHADEQPLNWPRWRAWIERSSIVQPGCTRRRHSQKKTSKGKWKNTWPAERPNLARWAAKSVLARDYEYAVPRLTPKQPRIRMDPEAYRALCIEVLSIVRPEHQTSRFECAASRGYCLEMICADFLTGANIQDVQERRIW